MTGQLGRNLDPNHIKILEQSPLQCKFEISGIVLETFKLLVKNKPPDKDGNFNSFRNETEIDNKIYLNDLYLQYYISFLTLIRLELALFFHFAEIKIKKYQS